MKNYKGNGPRGITARQLSIIVLMALVAAVILAINVSSDYTGESPSQTVVESFLKDPDADKPETGNSVSKQEDYENGKIEAALLSKARVIENCTITHYAACVECCGNDLGITASGRKATPYVSVAVDPGIIPLGSDVLVDYGDGVLNYYRADDTGSGVIGDHIDLCVEDYQTAKTLGVRTATVYYIPCEDIDTN